MMLIFPVSTRQWWCRNILSYNTAGTEYSKYLNLRVGRFKPAPVGRIEFQDTFVFFLTEFQKLRESILKSYFEKVTPMGKQEKRIERKWVEIVFVPKVKAGCSENFQRKEKLTSGNS